MRRIYDWKEIQRFHDEGNGFVKCRERFGLTHTAWNKAIKRGELHTVAKPFRDRRRRYDWAAVQAYYDQGNSFYECKRVFGFCSEAWQKARERGEIRTRPLGRPLSEVMLRGGSRHNVKARLLRAGLLENHCQICGLEAWLGRPLSIHIDHINGIRNDHRLENLRMLCPNCHSQTDTYSGKNARKKRLQEPNDVL
jgi:5-methylcytosine-specific restriction endonuclease McrA